MSVTSCIWNNSCQYCSALYTPPCITGAEAVLGECATGYFQHAADVMHFRDPRQDNPRLGHCSTCALLLIEMGDTLL